MGTILITGISGALGGALGKHFLSDGWSVNGIDLCAPEDFEGTPGFHFRRCDLGSADEIRGVINSFPDTESGFDAVINNAGIIYNSPIIRYEDGQFNGHDFAMWRKVIDVNLSAAFYVSVCCVEKMVQRGKKGVIINISSICANGNVGQPAYSASKAGLDGLTLSLAKELGPLGIRVAGVAPGYVDTQSTRENVDEKWLNSVKKATPTRRLVAIQSFVNSVDFIIRTPDFSGKILEIDGGLTL